MMGSIKQRYLFDHVLADLSSRMVFIGGPRQVGKTTFALRFLPESGSTFRGFSRTKTVQNEGDVYERIAASYQ